MTNTATFGFVPSSQPNQSLPQTQTNSFPSSQNPFYYPQNNQQPQISFGFTPQQNNQPNLFQYIPQQTIQQISYIQYTPQNVSTTLFTPRTLEEIENGNLKIEDKICKKKSTITVNEKIIY